MHALVMARAPYRLLTTAALTTLLVTGSALAQQKKHVSLGVAEMSKYVQQQSIDAADVPEHKLRIFEIRKTYSKGSVAFDGVGLVDESDWGYSDYVAGTGHNWGYTEFRLENGDKIWARFDGISHRKPTADGSAAGQGISTMTLTGGTGRFAAIKGTGQVSFEFDATKGVNASRIEMDYWMER